MAARRAVQAKALASSSNSSATLGPQQQQQQANRARIKSTSMTNLVAPSSEPSGQQASRPIQRPASRNALDSIHKGMNAKFTHVQSKVLLQNIRPQQQHQASKIPSSGSTLTRSQHARAKTHTPTAGAKIQQSDRSQLINKIKALQEELAGQEELRDELKQELERERADKQEQLAQMKLEVEEKARESERHNEDYHQKLLEAYELADQNRRAADSVLSESRQREDELRKKIDELEQQLAELKEFVSMKEEMQSKMGELREQIRAERERYEDKTRALNQMFETEKISAHMRVDQNSNYFKRVKGSLQSSESIDRLGEEPTSSGQGRGGGGGCGGCGGCGGGANGEPTRHHRSQNDIYGSKLSTRMQDGAKIAWKKSRKFASSVITGGLGGISACRRRERPLAKSQSGGGEHLAPGNYLAANLQVLGAHVARGGTIEVAAREEVVTEQPHLFQRTEAAGGEQHTSVIEVGEQQQPPAQPADLHQRAQLANSLDQPRSSSTAQQQQQQEHKQQISVDENNKLTIVTKFNGDSAECHQQPASASGSERSRCESSSSGRGTSSDCGSSASQNGDAERPKTPNGAETKRGGAEAAEQAADHQRHKRKSSLFKASEVLSDSQASLNKTFKSIFARKSSAAAALSDEKEPVAQARRRNHHSFDQAVPFDLASKSVFQEPPRLESFKQMRELARDQPAEQTGESNNNEICTLHSQAVQCESGAARGPDMSVHGQAAVEADHCHAVASVEVSPGF